MSSGSIQISLMPVAVLRRILRVELVHALQLALGHADQAHVAEVHHPALDATDGADAPAADQRVLQPAGVTGEVLALAERQLPVGLALDGMADVVAEVGPSVHARPKLKPSNAEL